MIVNPFMGGLFLTGKGGGDIWTPELSMLSNFFIIKNIIYRQNNGYPVGTDFSFQAASIYKTLWDRNFLR